MPLPPYVRIERSKSPDEAVPAVSVVIPAFNEAERIGTYLDAIAAYFAKRGEAHEILVVNDGSRDRTAEAIRERMARHPALALVHYDGNRGKGHAVRMGMEAARGGVRLFADADGSTPIEELERLRAALARGADVAAGSRALSSPEVRRKIKPHRYFIGQVFRILRQLLLNVRIVDSQCGFKLFTARAARALFPPSRVDGFAFDVELLYLAGRAGFAVAEVPVNWYDSASTRVNLLRDPPRMVLDMLRIRRLHRDTVLAPADGAEARG